MALEPGFQPSGIGLTWRGVLLEVARWPIVLWAVVNAALRIKRPYMITPKGARTGRPPAGARLYGPPLLLAEIALGAIAVFQAAGGHAPTQGYLALVLFNLVMVVTLLVTALALELRDLRRRRRSGRFNLRKETDWRIDSSPSARRAFADGIGRTSR